MKMFAVKVTKENLQYIEDNTVFPNPHMWDALKDQEMVLLAVLQGDGYEALCYVDVDGYIRDFEDISNINETYTEVAEL